MLGHLNAKRKCIEINFLLIRFVFTVPHSILKLVHQYTKRNK